MSLFPVLLQSVELPPGVLHDRRAFIHAVIGAGLSEVTAASKGQVSPAIAGIFGDRMVSRVSRLNHKPGRQTPQGGDDLWLLHFGTGSGCGLELGVLI